ncbi:MAG: ABC transporter permease [Pseudomonadales bacterium]|nr:ABC transporter permease [Pseudomonadales bacterium]
MMLNTILLAFRALRRNVLRSLLTMLGIVIGVAAVIAVVTLGAGASERITSQVSSLGDKLLFVAPGADRRGPQSGSAVRQFTRRDSDAVGKDIFGIEGVSPTVAKKVTTVHGNKNWSTSVTGITEEYFRVRNAGVIRGSDFSAQHYQSGRLTCILGKTVREELFGAVDSVGSTIRIGNATCQVIGELESKGQAGFGNDQDNIILAPLRAVQIRLIGNENITSIAVSVGSGATNSEIKSKIEELMRDRRNIRPKDEDDFRVLDPTEITGVLEDVTGILTLFLSAIAAVSLLVGGIGIMNIMLVSVTERTREIGIRLAIGALEKEVLAQFLVEAVILTTLGGCIGISIGLAGSYMGSLYMGFEFNIDPTIVIGAFAFSALVGVVFGFVPARRAARLDPIEALRHE